MHKHTKALKTAQKGTKAHKSVQKHTKVRRSAQKRAKAHRSAQKRAEARKGWFNSLWILRPYYLKILFWNHATIGVIFWILIWRCMDWKQNKYIFLLYIQSHTSAHCGPNIGWSFIYQKIHECFIDGSKELTVRWHCLPPASSSGTLKVNLMRYKLLQLTLFKGSTIYEDQS